jgi:hypothetical protein
MKSLNAFEIARLRRAAVKVKAGLIIVPGLAADNDFVAALVSGDYTERLAAGELSPSDWAAASLLSEVEA